MFKLFSVFVFATSLSLVQQATAQTSYVQSPAQTKKIVPAKAAAAAEKKVLVEEDEEENNGYGDGSHGLPGDSDAPLPQLHHIGVGGECGNLGGVRLKCAGRPFALRPRGDYPISLKKKKKKKTGVNPGNYGQPGDDAFVALRWNKQLLRMRRISTTTGAIRFESKRHGLVWIGIPSKSLLLDSKKGQQLANECKNLQQVLNLS